MKSKYVIINGIEDVSILEEEIDDQLSKDEYLIETEVSLISAGTELSRVYGLKKGAKYPSRPGYCSVGKVLKVGNPNSKIQVGDRVLFSGPHASLSKFNPATSDGSVLFKLDEKTDSIDGTFLEMCWIAMNGILPADVKLSDKVAVVGLGTLGLVCSLYYKQMGVDVVAIEPVAKRAQIARELGITTVDCSIANQVEEAMKASDNKGYDIVVDATGLSVGIELACKIAATYGQVLLMGSPRTDYVTNITDTFSAIHMKMLTVIGALIPSVVKAKLGFEFHYGEISLKLQDVANQLMPGLVPLLVVLLTYWLLGLKRMNSTRVIFILMFIGVVGYNLNILS